MAVRVPVAPEVVEWAMDRSHDAAGISESMPKVREWIDGVSRPTLNQLSNFAARTGTPFGYLLLPEPPRLELPIDDFRDGFNADAYREPSSDLLAVINQSIRRQDWYRDYASDLDLPEVEVVGRAADWEPTRTAADMRKELGYEVAQRSGTRRDQRRYLLQAFEDLGGLAVATSMVENNNHHLLDIDEFRGFSLIDETAPLIFVNTGQTLNGQLFTLAHEFAHVWRGIGGVGVEDPGRTPQSTIERWCNRVASEFLVPEADLHRHFRDVHDEELVAQLEALSRIFKCGTLVVLQAIERAGLRRFDDFPAAYEAEVARLKGLSPRQNSGGDFYANQPYRIGERLSHALIDDVFGGRTAVAEAIKLMSFKSLSTFDKYARHLDREG